MVKRFKIIHIMVALALLLAVAFSALTTYQAAVAVNWGDRPYIRPEGLGVNWGDGIEPPDEEVAVNWGGRIFAPPPPIPPIQ